VIDIESVDIDSMSKENKQDALHKMQSVMENMQALMAKLSQATS
jgi:hypothetical protein